MFSFNSSIILLNCSNADSKFSAISAAKTSGAGRLSVSSRLSSLNQKISRLALSRWVSSAYVKDLKHSVGFQSRQSHHWLVELRLFNRSTLKGKGLIHFWFRISVSETEENAELLPRRQPHLKQ